MSSLSKLKNIKSLHELAALFKYKPSKLAYIIYKIPDESKYTVSEIKKKSGGTRTIKAPTPKLKALQKKLAHLLNDCYDEIHKNKGVMSHGFRRKYSIITNAEKHINKRHVFNIDLEDFFPTFNFGRVRGFFIKDKNFELEPKMATIIAQITCHDHSLPQGSPTSPIISNLIGHMLDVVMVSLAKKEKCTYSRYADDLTFSTNQQNFPTSIAELKEGVWTPGSSLLKGIERAGFKINESKTTFQSKKKRQTTTGLIVNKKVNIKREYIKEVRGMCHSLISTGEFYSLNKLTDEKEKGEINSLEGKLSFIHSITMHNNHKDRKSIKSLNLTKKEKWQEEKKIKNSSAARTYRNFLFYKYFFLCDKPLIICEGKTDQIYIKCTLNNTKEEYPLLIDKNEKQKKYQINFFPMTKNKKNVFMCSDGTSGIASILKTYDGFLKFLNKFQYAKPNNPVIILIDNDEGASPIVNIMNNILKGQNREKECNKDANFYLLYENLYLVKTPLKPGQKYSSIEDCFDSETLGKKINNKTFSKNNDYDKSKNYGKGYFAEKIVKAGQKDIKYEGFKPLLNRISDAIQHFQNTVNK